MARSAPSQAAARVRRIWAFGSTSSTIASTARSQSARSVGSVVTLMFDGSAPSSFAHSVCACSSARHADASERASSITSEVNVAHAASPQAIVPLPAIAGRS